MVFLNIYNCAWKLGYLKSNHLLFLQKVRCIPYNYDRREAPGLKIIIQSKSAISNIYRLSITPPLKMYSKSVQLLFSHIMKWVRKWSLTDHILSSVVSSIYILNRHTPLFQNLHNYKHYSIPKVGHMPYQLGLVLNQDTDF